MRTLIFLLRKEFKQIFRNKVLSKAIFLVPLVQMLILVPAVTFEIKNIRLCIVDHDMSPESRELVSRLQGSKFFMVKFFSFSEEDADKYLFENKADIALVIPENFSDDLFRGGITKLQARVNAINATSAQLSWAYLSGVVRDYNNTILMEQVSGTPATIKSISITNRYWYNAMLNYKYYMLPGILVILVTAIGLLLSGLNMVREKESGTIEQINVTPVRKSELIFAKIIPFILIGLADLALGLIVGKIAFDIPFNGSILLMFFCATIFLIGVLGLALFFSTFSGTQQQYMFVSFFVVMIFILMSGIFTPAESMPVWAQKFNLVNPVSYLMKINRMVMLKGSGFRDISGSVYALLILATVFTTLAVNRYRKTA